MLAHFLLFFAFDIEISFNNNFIHFFSFINFISFSDMDSPIETQDNVVDEDDVGLQIQKILLRAKI